MVGENNSNAVLKAKIEWYREILILEPNSKVFLPFARHLAEIGSSESDSNLLNEAFDVLRRGLLLHPDFMEARLFHIELLNSCDCRSQCGAEVARLASLFLSYPDFWDAWREHSIVENESSDFTIALGFMGAILKDKTVSIVQVLEAGLASLRTPLMNQIKNNTTAKIPNLPNDSSENFSVSNLDKDNMKKLSSFLNTTSPAVLDSVEEKRIEEELIGEALIEEECVGEIEIPILIEQNSCGDSTIFPESHIANYLDYTQRYQNNEHFAKQTLATLLADTSIVVEPMETAPVQTRSMAEVLSEQGDLGGAIEIYKKLIEQASDADVLSLKNRLIELEACASNSKKNRQDTSGLFAIDDLVDTSFFTDALNKVEAKSCTEDCSVSENFLLENPKFEESLLKEFTIEEIMAEKFFLKDVTPYEFLQEELLPHELISEEPLADELLAHEFLPEELLTDVILPEELLPEDILPEEFLFKTTGLSSEELLLEEPILEELFLGEFLLDETESVELSPVELVLDGTESVELSPVELVLDGTESLELSPAELMLEEPVSVELFLEEPVLDEIESEELSPAEVVPEETALAELVLEEPFLEEIVLEEPVSEESSFEEIVPEELLPEELLTDVILPEELLPEELLPEEFLPEASLSEKLLPEELADINSAVEEFLLRNVRKEDKLLDDISFDEFIADELVPDDSIPGNKSTQSTSNIVDLLNKLATRLEEKASL